MKTRVLGMVLGVAILGLTTGCEQPRPGETYRKVAVAFPIFDSEKTEGINPDGSKWTRDKGDVICFLGVWDKKKTYDKEGFLIERDEKSWFFPFASTEVHENAEKIHKKGSFLFWPNESVLDKKTGKTSGKK